jgi:peptide/nickel transport system permease protein
VSGRGVATGAVPGPPQAVRARAPGRGRPAPSRVLRSGSLLAGGVIVASLLAVAIGAPWLAPHVPTAIFPGREIQPPSSGFLLGTDEVGRDVLSRVLYGTRVSLGVAIPSVGLAAALGASLGVCLGYFGGALDLLAARLFDVLFAFPPILLAIALVAALGPSTINLILTIAVLTLPQFAVLARSATLAVKPQEFVQAARALGASHARLLGAHVLPSIAPTLAVQASLSLSIVILVEAALSFLGLGTQPPAPSWGSMLSRGRQYMTIAPWLVLAPGVAIMLAVLGFNLLGDAQRDLLDPRRSGARGTGP